MRRVSAVGKKDASSSVSGIHCTSRRQSIPHFEMRLFYRSNTDILLRIVIGFLSRGPLQVVPSVLLSSACIVLVAKQKYVSVQPPRSKIVRVASLVAIRKYHGNSCQRSLNNNSLFHPTSGHVFESGVVGQRSRIGMRRVHNRGKMQVKGGARNSRKMDRLKRRI